MATIKQRFDEAFAVLVEQGITPTLVSDERAYVRSEYLAAYQKAADDAGTPGRWVGISRSGLQWNADGAPVFENALLYIQPIRTLYADFPHTAPEIAEAAVAAFRGQGFEVLWSASLGDCVVIELT